MKLLYWLLLSSSSVASTTRSLLTTLNWWGTTLKQGYVFYTPLRVNFLQGKKDLLLYSSLFTVAFEVSRLPKGVYYQNNWYFAPPRPRGGGQYGKKNNPASANTNNFIQTWKLFTLLTWRVRCEVLGCAAYSEPILYSVVLLQLINLTVRWINLSVMSINLSVKWKNLSVRSINHQIWQ